MLDAVGLGNEIGRNLAGGMLAPALQVSLFLSPGVHAGLCLSQNVRICNFDRGFGARYSRFELAGVRDVFGLATHCPLLNSKILNFLAHKFGTYQALSQY